MNVTLAVNSHAPLGVEKKQLKFQQTNSA